MVKKTHTFSQSFAWVSAGQMVNLKEFGFDERFVIYKAYFGPPRCEDMVPGGYDLSNVYPRDERLNANEEQLEEWKFEDMTIIVARKPGDQGIVFYISDFDQEVEVYDDEFYDVWMKSTLEPAAVSA